MSHIVREFGKDNKSLKEVTESLAQFVGGLERQQCAICFGWGHLANRCATKATIDQACRGNPEWKVVWGSFKAKYKLEAATNRANEAYDAIKAQQWEEEEEEEQEYGWDTQEQQQYQQQQQQLQQQFPNQSNGANGQYHQQMHGLVEDKADGSNPGQGNVAQYPFGSVANPLQQ
uniref:Uncharacterized protein n=1 Tax=Stylonychia lemnae TaxID=5949 RepID=Q27189_STYLE|nr:unknown [Stylonychia lemnae]